MLITLSVFGLIIKKENGDDRVQYAQYGPLPKLDVLPP
jgi:hypothetical protein